MTNTATVAEPSATPRNGSANGLLDIPGLAEYLGVRESWVRERITARAIPHRRIGKHVRFAPADIEQIVADTYQPPQPAPTRDEVVRRMSDAA